MELSDKEIESCPLFVFVSVLPDLAVPLPHKWLKGLGREETR